MRPVTVILLLALTGCSSGGNSMNKGQTAPALSAGPDRSIQTIDGRTIELGQLAREGPVVLVLLRGFS